MNCKGPCSAKNEVEMKKLVFNPNCPKCMKIWMDWCEGKRCIYQVDKSIIMFSEDMTKFDYQNILFEFVLHLDEKMKNRNPSCGVYQDDCDFHLRCAVAEAYNTVTEYNAQKINPFAHEIEPKDAVSLNDTITCPFTKDHSQGCGCFGRGYVTIRMLSEQGIREHVQDKKKQDDYIKLQNGEKLELMMPTMWEHRKSKEIQA